MREILKLSPKQIVDVLRSSGAAHIAQEAFERHFRNHWIVVDGGIEKITAMSGYITLTLRDSDGIHISANIKKPIDPEIAALTEGSTIRLVGRLFNATNDIVVLDHCDVDPGGAPSQVGAEGAKHLNWWEMVWVQTLFLIAAILGIIAFFASFGPALMKAIRSLL